MIIDGSAGSLTQTDGTKSANYSGILCSLRDEIARVSIFDVWGFGLWIFGDKAAYTRVIDCEADLGQNARALLRPDGNDCIGGGAKRSKIVRFYWMPTLAKNTALDFTAPGGSSLKEVSVDIIDCINESSRDVVLEGAFQSTIRGNRFYGNDLAIKTDAAYPILGHPAVTNPADILVADNLFMGIVNAQQQYVGGSCVVQLDGGIYCPSKGQMGKPLNNGGRIAILGNSFINSAGGDPSKPASAIMWGGDDKSNSDGGSIIAHNRIVNPNPNGIASTVNLKGGCGNMSLGDVEGSGISVLSSYGLTIFGNTIDDTNPSASQKMHYSMQLFSATGLIPFATMQRIIVENNLCGSASGVGNGSVATFLYNPNESDALPRPILRRNTNQQSGYDMQASNEISGLASGAQWPLAGGYPYDAIVYVHGATRVDIDGSDTELLLGGFYLPAGHHITIHWTSAPTARVFR